MELVNHPNHYNMVGRKECIDEIVDVFGVEYAQVFCLTNAYKYLYRAGNKDGNTAFQDMKKCRWYLEWAKSHGNEKLVKEYNFLYVKCERWFEENGEDMY